MNRWDLVPPSFATLAFFLPFVVLWFLSFSALSTLSALFSMPPFTLDALISFPPAVVEYSIARHWFWYRLSDTTDDLVE